MNEGRPLRLARAAAQLLGTPERRTPEDVVRRLLAVQAQDPAAARLALRARAAGLAAADVDRALADGSLVVSWLLRGTLHLVRRDDWAWLRALAGPRHERESLRRLAEEGVAPEDAERAVTLVERALAADGPLARPAVRARLAAAGVRTEGQATHHLLRLAALRGVAVLGPVRDGMQAFVLARDWVGEPAPVERGRALAELGRRYLAGHAPADAADLAAWAGLPLGEARAALRDAAVSPSEPAAAPPRLLPAFDPYLLGWKDRSFAVAPGEARRVHPGGGVIRPVVLVDGLAAGTWRARAGRVALEPFAPLAPADAAALAGEAAAVERFLLPGFGPGAGG